MSFDNKVSETCKACYFHIRALRNMCASLTTEASKTIAAAIIDSRLDFCNSLLAGTSVSNLTRLQRVQNTLARVVTKKPRSCHMTPVLFDLHWLQVRHRITFKIATVDLQSATDFECHPTLKLTGIVMCRREHSALLLHFQYPFTLV